MVETFFEDRVQEVFEKSGGNSGFSLSKFPKLVNICRRTSQISNELGQIILNEDYEVRNILLINNKPPKVMVLNLSAASMALGKTPKKIHNEGNLIPSLLIYFSLAEIWDDYFDCVVKNGEVIDSSAAFVDSNAGDVFDMATKMIDKNEKLEESAKKSILSIVNDAKDGYIKFEGSLAGKHLIQGLGKDETREFVIGAKIGGFGRTAHALTLLMSGNDFDTEESRKAADKMLWFSLFGGLIDDIIDGDNECLNLGTIYKDDKLGGVKQLLSFLEKSL